MRDIIDFHSHVLPGIDDGSKSVDMSLEMLRAASQQGITVMIATPHFYADRSNPEAFFKKRSNAKKQLFDENMEGLPRILCGAEVAHFRGMGHTDDIESFCIEGTSLLLVEMPFRSWGRSDLRDIEELMERGIQPVIAHIERFFSLQKDRESIERLLGMPVCIQVNSEALLDWRQRHKVLKLFRNGQANLLGSDCHNTSTRPQNLLKGREVLKKKFGQGFLDSLDDFGQKLIDTEECLI